MILVGKYWTQTTEAREKIRAAKIAQYRDRWSESVCQNCSNIFAVTKSRLAQGRGKYCSKSCQYSHKKGTNLNPETQFKKGQNKGSDNCNWKEDDYGYDAVHRWLEREHGKPNHCDHCGTEDPDKKYDWANKSGEYRRDRDDFLRLCKHCHAQYDHDQPKKPGKRFPNNKRLSSCV